MEGQWLADSVDFVVQWAVMTLTAAAGGGGFGELVRGGEERQWPWEGGYKTSEESW